MENLSGESLANLSQAVVRLAQAATTLSTAAQAMAVAAEFFIATTLNLKFKGSDGLASYELTVTAVELAIDEQKPVPENRVPEGPPKINSSVKEGNKDVPQLEEQPDVEAKDSYPSSKNPSCISVYTITHILAEHVHADFLSSAMANIRVDEKLVFQSSEAVKVISTFEDLGLKEDLLRGIYAYSTC
jgi:hypothetical protein